jgi:hypothetical protein
MVPAMAPTRCSAAANTGIRLRDAGRKRQRQLPRADSVGVSGRDSRRLAITIMPHTGAPYDMLGELGFQGCGIVPFARHWKERSTL